MAKNKQPAAKPETETAAKTKAEYEKLGREIESLYQASQPGRRVFYRMAFIKGILTGIGGVLGATLGIALLLWILSFFTQLPLIGNFVETIEQTIQTDQQ